MEKMEQVAKQKLLNKMKRTKNNRFNFSRRLEKKANAKSNATSIISLFCLVVSIYLLAYADDINPQAARFSGVLIAGLSILSMMLSLDKSVSDLQKSSDKAHRCAREVSEVRGHLELDVIDASTARIKYEGILNLYEENHDDCDNWKTLYDNKLDFAEDSKNVGFFKGVIPYFISSNSPYLFAVFCAVVILSVWFIVSHFSPHQESSVSFSFAFGMQ